MENDDGRFERLVAQVGVERAQVLRHHQGFVNDDAAGQVGDVELAVTLGFKNLLGAAARLKEF